MDLGGHPTDWCSEGPFLARQWGEAGMRGEEMMGKGERREGKRGNEHGKQKNSRRAMFLFRVYK